MAINCNVDGHVSINHVLSCPHSRSAMQAQRQAASALQIEGRVGHGSFLNGYYDLQDQVCFIVIRSFSSALIAAGA